MKFNWPGNIRELQNIVERLVLTTNSDYISVDNLPVFLTESAQNDSRIQKGRDEELSLSESMNAAESRILTDALAKYKTTRSMARALGVSQPTIVRKLHKHGILSADTE